MTSIITVATSAGGLVTLSIADATGSFSGLLSSAHYTLLFQATANSTVSTLVARDASSNFAANFITANKVTGLTTPSADSDAANKKYVDDTVSGLAWKDAVHVATTANLTSLSGLQTIDAHVLLPGERVLVKDQTSTGAGGFASPEHGIWIASASAWTRALDADTEAELLGTSVLVQQGTTWQNTQWIMTTDAIPTLYVPGGTIATSSPIAFTQFGTGSSVYTAGDGLVQVGQAFNVVGTANRITVAADFIDISTAYAGQSTITTLGTINAGTWNATAIGAGFGGTGQTTYAIGDILYASAATTLSKLADVVTGNVLISGGVTIAPAWGKVQLAGVSQHVTGTLAIGNGGTGGTATATAGAVAYGASGVYAFTAAGTAGQTLISGGAGAPAFGQVSLSSGSAGVSGTLAVVNGGTGSATALVAGGLAVAASTTAYGTIAAVAAGSVLLSAGINTAPAFGQLDLASTVVTGTLPIARGGTNGAAAATAGAIAYGTGTAYAFTTAGTSGQALLSGGAAAPTFGAINLATTAVTGTLGIANGGTGSGSVSGARTALATPTQVFGDVGNSGAAIQITHSMNTKDVNVEVYETATGSTVYCDVTRDTVNTVTLTFSGTPAAANTYRYVITGRTV
jgi:hypothetical protein